MLNAKPIVDTTRSHLGPHSVLVERLQVLGAQRVDGAGRQAEGQVVAGDDPPVLGDPRRIDAAETVRQLGVPATTLAMAKAHFTRSGTRRGRVRADSSSSATTLPKAAASSLPD